jgi:hypothetical protein
MTRKAAKEPEVMAPEPVKAELVTTEPVGGGPLSIRPANMDLQTLMARALENNASVETIERLMALEDRLREQWARQQFFKDLASFQASVPPIERSKGVKEKTGGGVRYYYAPYEDIVRTIGPHLERYGFSHTEDTVMQPMSKDEQTAWTKSKGWLVATCEIHHRDGHSKTSTFRVPIGSEFMTIQQEFGSASTFAKRYALLNALGLSTVGEDTDGVAPKDDAPRGGGGADHRYKSPTPKPSSQRQEPAPEPDPDPGKGDATRKKFPGVRRAAEPQYRILASNLKTVEANMKRRRSASRWTSWTGAA